MTERGEVPSAKSHHGEAKERLFAAGREPRSRCFCCSLQQNISEVSVVRLGRPGFSIGMRLRKQRTPWLFVAALRFFAKARSIADRKCMAAGDYQLDSEIATRNSHLSNYGEDPSAACRFLCHAPQTAASGGLRSFAATAANDDVAP